MLKLHGEYRRHLRSGIRLPVILKYASHTIATSTLDVSASGLRLKRPERVYIRPGERIDVDFPNRADLTVTATVTHSGKSHLGVQFYRRRFSDDELRQLYDLAPPWQRLAARSKRALWTNSRRCGVLLANTFLRAPLQALVRPQFLFAVYGNREQAGAYFTPAMARPLPPNLMLGFIRHGDMRGLLIASQFMEDELEQDSAKVRRYLEQLQQNYPGVLRIALVGRLPNFVMKAGLKITGPLVEGSLGNAVCRDLTRLYQRVIGFDPRYVEDREITTDQGRILQTASPTHLKDESCSSA